MIQAQLLTDQLCTQGYHIIEDFLAPKDYQALRTHIQELAQQGQLRSAKIGQKLAAHRNDAIRTDSISWLDENSPNSTIQLYLKKITELAKTLNQSLFLNLSEFETHFAAYQPGSYYKKHVDQFANNKDRKISFVYYLNSDWQEDFGGQLKLYDADDQLLTQVLPQPNRFICFKSELPHEVCLTQQSRYSIAGWLKSRS
ncbi:MAG: 2OG-Fe(II) oxygenase [Legionella sp.]|nr:MAG: 2OG-Fe(II) oxygenase [Legionella sp.]